MRTPRAVGISAGVARVAELVDAGDSKSPGRKAVRVRVPPRAWRGCVNPTTAMTVLLVEDDPGIREGMTELLSERDEVVAVATVQEAEILLNQRRFDLVITDLQIGRDAAGG